MTTSHMRTRIIKKSCARRFVGLRVTINRDYEAALADSGRPQMKAGFTAMHLKVLSCEIAKRELLYVAARSKNEIDLELLPQGYHDVPASGREQIQKHIDAVYRDKYDAIVLGYGLCG